jgi:peptidoglycan/xylan/chitin deacetylase (PgdA/CDA1 family)
VAEGHEIGNHSWSHPNLAKLSDEGVRTELQRTEDIIVKTTGVRPKLMRPPYGELAKRQRILVNHDFGYKVILWDVDPLDWKRPGSNVVAQRIITGARPGSIILSHDIHPPTIAAMPQVFDTLLAKGFKFVTVSELLAMDKGGERRPSK